MPKTCGSSRRRGATSLTLDELVELRDKGGMPQYVAKRLKPGGLMDFLTDYHNRRFRGLPPLAAIAGITVVAWRLAQIELRPMSSFHRSGCALMKSVIRRMHVASCSTVSDTPLERSSSSSPQTSGSRRR